MFFCHEEIDGLASGVNDGLIEIEIETHGDPRRGGFAAWPLIVQVLADHELESTDKRRLHGRDVDLAVALPACPSPASKSAPKTCTGMKSFVPSTRSLL